MLTNGNRVLVIFHTKQVESGSELILGIYSMHFIQYDTPPNLAYHKPWLTESSGACQQSHTMEECLFNFLYFWMLQWTNQLFAKLMTSR